MMATSTRIAHDVVVSGPHAQYQGGTYRKVFQVEVLDGDGFTLELVSRPTREEAEDLGETLSARYHAPTMYQDLTGRYENARREAAANATRSRR